MSILKRRLGIPGLLAILALVMAMGGGAWAAKRYVITSTKQIKPSVLKQLRGKQGPAGAQGATGATGAQGAQGAQGAAGKDGTNGTNGTNGAPGAPGKNVEIGTATGAECEPSGITVQVEGEPGTKKAVCDGEDGGFDGSPLPPGATMTGTWALRAFAAGQQVFSPISFQAPVEPAPEAIYVSGTSAAGCPGIVGGVPTADPGKLCVYKALQAGNAVEVAPGIKAFFTKPTGSGLDFGTSPQGTILQIVCEASSCSWYGSWAVTAPTA